MFTEIHSLLSTQLTVINEMETSLGQAINASYMGKRLTEEISYRDAHDNRYRDFSESDAILRRKIADCKIRLRSALSHYIAQFTTLEQAIETAAEVTNETVRT